MQGWLSKQGSMLQGRKRMFFRLKDNALWYSEDETSDPEGSHSLAGVKSAQGLPLTKKDSYPFELVFESGTRLQFAADSEQSRQDWIEHIITGTQFGNIELKYELKQTLGSGGFSEVKECIERSSGAHFAVKIILRQVFVQNKKDMLNEIEIMRKVHHPNIAFLKEVIESAANLYIVQELMAGGDLVTRILERGSQTEKQAANAVSKVMAAVAYLHDLGIVHRDMKLENCVYTAADDSGTIKIIDFGLSKFETRTDPGPYRIVGTPEYMAPEILKQKGYEKPVDMWACGVLTYILLSGCYPFSGETTEETFREILRGRVEFPSPEWDHVSKEAKTLITKLLEPDPKHRLSAKQASRDPWLVGLAPDNLLPQQNLENLRNLRARRRLKKAIVATMALNIFGSGEQTTRDGQVNGTTSTKRKFVFALPTKVDTVPNDRPAEQEVASS
eukprot:CAMPEP_0184662152 /NCGR_PEP_ID=MMETSP0308-20130426/41885_1 /TAXON_ID=38269 /ORGANISM="Gloeochaete witrockiana, Strain SAG 46.84" /LENGTH=444 /DNA_ID=CAMNT_0027103957 /DNA_START=217 /DNA_END=1551 /DNA_ORIENTATION=+